MDNNVTAVRAFSGKKLSTFLKNYGAIFGMLVLLLVFQVFDNRFLRIANIWSVCKSSTFLVLMALGMTLVMSVRGIDFSIAQVADASAVIAAFLIINGIDPMLALVASLGFGLIIGCINAVLMAYLGVPALVGTLGVMFLVRSFELVLTDGAQPQVIFTMSKAITGKFLSIGQGSTFAIPNVLIVCIVAILIIYLLKERSVLGRHMDSLSGNVRSAFLSGVNIRRTFAAVFIISSLLAAIAGILICARAGNATPRAVESYLNDCFVAVYLGTLISKKRKFNVMGTVIGCLFVGFMSNFFTLMGLSNGIKHLCNGTFILLAVVLGTVQSHKKS